MTIKKLSKENFTNKPISKVTRDEVVKYLENLNRQIEWCGFWVSNSYFGKDGKNETITIWYKTRKKKPTNVIRFIASLILSPPMFFSHYIILVWLYLMMNDNFHLKFLFSTSFNYSTSKTIDSYGRKFKHPSWVDESL